MKQSNKTLVVTDGEGLQPSVMGNVVFPGPSAQAGCCGPLVRTGRHYQQSLFMILNRLRAKHAHEVIEEQEAFLHGGKPEPEGA